MGTKRGPSDGMLAYWLACLLTFCRIDIIDYPTLFVTLHYSLSLFRAMLNRIATIIIFALVHYEHSTDGAYPVCL
jgi:hypothetical protein